jgi:hypothetical protein
MASVNDSLAEEFPPLGSRCAVRDCDEVATFVEPVECGYGEYALQHRLYFCKSHLRAHRAGATHSGTSGRG